MKSPFFFACSMMGQAAHAKLPICFVHCARTVRLLHWACSRLALRLPSKAMIHRCTTGLLLFRIVLYHRLAEQGLLTSV